MFKTLKAILRADRTAATVREIEKNTSQLKKATDKLVTQGKAVSEKQSADHQALTALKAHGHLLNKEIQSLKVLCGNLAAQRARSLPAGSSLREAEFQVFSQWGEDGIIQYLLSHVRIEHEIFVEFGVESYQEANTRFLLLNNYWSGLIIDGSEEHMAAVTNSDLAWRHTLHARSAWITAENINDVISSAGISGDIGLLSVDIDGVDYWVWKAIHVVQPRIVIAEYNSLYGPKAKVTPPYDPTFERGKAHFSHVFYGASLAALDHLAQEKGYRLLGTNSAGNNAFFVRADLAPALPTVTPEQTFQPARFREARLASGELAFRTFDDARRLIQDCVVHDITTGVDCPLKNAVGWDL
jgi:hypothetical protein